MTNLRCDKCGKYLGHYIVGSDPATGKITFTTPGHFFCTSPRDAKGKFIRRSLVEQLEPLQYAYNIQAFKLANCLKP